eukprot:gene6208-10214_t
MTEQPNQPKQPNNVTEFFGMFQNATGKPNFKGNPTQMLKRSRGSRYLLPLILGGTLIYKCLNIIPAGNIGVVDIFPVQEKVLQLGIHVVNPFAKVAKISLQTRKLSSTIQVPSQEGVVIELESSLLYKLDTSKVVEMYKTVGLNYEKVTKDVKNELQDLIGHRGVIVEDVPLKNIKLPEKLTKEIEFKLSAEQESQKMKFILEKEKLEAERKRIEAQGISDFQKIVSEGISEQLLVWKGIEATEKLAESTNSKVIVVGGGKNGLPLILNSKK